MINLQFLLAGVIAVAGGALHVYTMEVWIWPKLGVDCFPATRFGDAYVTRGFYRTVWHFFTVSFLGTILALFVFAFADAIPYVNLIVLLLCVYWIAIVVVIFVVSALLLRPGQSYIKVMLQAYQWVILLVMVGLMFWGTRR